MAIAREKLEIAEWLLGLLRGGSSPRVPAPRLMLGAEVGVKKGELAGLLLERDPALSLYLVDRWKPAPQDSEYRRIGDPAANASAEQFRAWEREALERVKPYEERVTVLKGESADMAASLVQDRNLLDFAFIDADHSYSGRLDDLCVWSPMVRGGGIVAGGLLVSAYGGDCGRRALWAYLDQSGLSPHDVLLGPANTWAFEMPRRAVRAAVLCPGPSLTAFAGRVGYDLVIGVNRAVGLFPCDYWVMLDDHTFDIAHPIGTPRVLCPRDQWAKVSRRTANGAAKDFKVLAPEDVDGTLPRRQTPWHKWSATAAIALACHLGATEIDCWGMDWEGTADWDGDTRPFHCRDEARWHNEQKSFRIMEQAMRARRVALRRIKPRPAGEADAIEDRADAARLQRSVESGWL